MGIERLDRKLAEAIDSNIVEKCEVTLTRAIQPFTSDVLTLSFLLLWTSSASVEFYKLTTLDKMILLAVKLSRLGVSSTQLKQAFNFLSFIFRPRPKKTGDDI